MPQAFGKSANTLAKLGVYSLFLGPAGLVAGLAEYNLSPWVTEAHVAQAQPVPFSHKHHVGGLGLDCRYCHTSVEDSSFAGIPPIKTCMTCHSQIWVNSPMLAPIRESFRTGQAVQWNRVYDLPDYVYFNHSAHIHAGVGCTDCHGRLDQMPLTRKAEPLNMGWCLDCHRQPELHVRPKEAVFAMEWDPPANQRALGLVQLHARHVQVSRLTNCSVCHR